MCLQNIKSLEIAEEDIICYKRLVELPQKELLLKCDKKPFKGIIRGISCEGMISIEYENNIYFCTDHERLDGECADNKHGYKYSWAMDTVVTEIIVEGEPIPRLSYTPYQRAHIEIGETYQSELIANQDDTVDVGLHSFASLDDAKEDGKGVYAECIIPKGSEYYEGTFIDCKSYASDTLTYVKLIN